MPGDDALENEIYQNYTSKDFETQGIFEDEFV
jgi:hypothetical protein